MFELDIRSYFTPASVAQTLKGLALLRTKVMDRVYPESVRQQHPLPVLGVDEVTQVINNVAVVRRGTPAIPLSSGTRAITYIEPQPVEISDFLDAVSLNNLRLLPSEGVQQYMNNKIDNLRRSCRKTAEALAGQSLSGKISYPMKIDGGYDLYEVDFGSTLTHNPATTWDDSGKKVQDILGDLIDITTVVQDKGYGAEIVFLAGTTAFLKLAGLVLGLSGRAIKAEISKRAITLAGFSVELFTGTYIDPSDGSTKKVVDDKKLCSVALDASFGFKYCAIDDVDIGFLPMPFYASPEKKKNPSGWEIVGKSKPFPLPVVNAICWSTVIA